MILDPANQNLFEFHEQIPKLESKPPDELHKLLKKVLFRL